MAGESSTGTDGRVFGADVLWRGVCADQWSSERLYDKARGILHTSVLAIVAMAFGTAGVAEVYGVDLANLEVSASLAGVVVPALSLGAGSLGAVLAAMLFGAIGLGIFRAAHLLPHASFVGKKDGGNHVDEEILDGYVGMSKKDVYGLYKAHIHRMWGLQRNNRIVGWCVVLGQWSLFSGIATMAILAIFLISHMVGSITLV